MSQTAGCRFCRQVGEKRFLALHYATQHSEHPLLHSVIQWIGSRPVLIELPSETASHATIESQLEACRKFVDTTIGKAEAVKVGLPEKSSKQKKKSKKIAPLNSVAEAKNSSAARRTKSLKRATDNSWLRRGPPIPMTTCPHCKESVAKNMLQEHIKVAHTNNFLRETRRPSTWIHIWQGGLPGLGKRR